MDGDIKAQLGRAALRALFCDDAADVSDEDARGSLDALRNAWQATIRDIAARAIAAEYLRLADPTIAELVEPVTTGLKDVGEGRSAKIFRPRVFGTIIGMPRLVEVARNDLARYAALVAEYCGAEAETHGDDASLTATVGVDRYGRKQNGVTPRLPLSGRSRSAARELWAKGVKLTSADDRRRFRAAGLAARRGEQIDPEVAAYLDGWRARFSTDAESEWRRAGVLKRKRAAN
jgi:hypothetical protein